MFVMTGDRGGRRFSRFTNYKNLFLPVDGEFAWVNQGTATSVTNYQDGSISLTAPATAGDSVRARVRIAPATPWSVVALFAPTMVGVNNSGTVVQNSSIGIVGRQSSDGKLVTFSLTIIVTTNTNVAVQKWTNATTFSAGYITSIIERFSPGFGFPIYMKMADDGTNRICSISSDGINFLTVHTIGRTDFLTVDQIGFYSQSGNATNNCINTLQMWKMGR